MDNLTLGSLFDGSGGFPLGGMLAGITPVWASEIDPFPIRVTTKRLPLMKHYGNVSEMDGGKVEPVDIITFGSPCQDMSVAGKRAGLDGSRSNLFYEAVRIIKEMRCATNGKYPKYIVWENVPGAFSSNKGEDFRCVLESICHIKDETVSVPTVKKWLSAGSILGDGYSITWRVLDAQFWGVPQRRKRIYLVADFNGGSAEKILFDSEGLSGYSAQGFRSWQAVARRPEDSLGKAVSHVALENHPADSRVKIEEDGVVQTLSSRMGTGGNNVPLVMKIRSGCEAGYTVRRLTPTECARLQGFPDWWCADLGTKYPSDKNVCFWYNVFKTYTEINGFKMKSDKQLRKWLQNPNSDSAEYKMWGNGVALPCVYFVMSGIVWANKFKAVELW